MYKEANEHYLVLNLCMSKIKEQLLFSLLLIQYNM